MSVTETGVARRLLVRRFGAGVGSVTPLARGQRSSAFAATWRGRAVVARFGALVEDFALDEMAARWAGPGSVVPAVLDRFTVPGGWCCVTERRAGHPLECLGPTACARVLPAVFDALADVGAGAGPGRGRGPIGADGTAPFPSWAAFLGAVAEDGAGRDAGGRAPLGRSGAAGAFDRGAAVVADLARDCPDDRRLVHGDLARRNVLVANERPSAVLDWGCALWGDPLYDVALLAFAAPWRPGGTGAAVVDTVLTPARLERLGAAHLDERLRCYLVHVGLAALASCARRGRRRDLARLTGRMDEVLDGRWEGPSGVLLI